MNVSFQKTGAPVIHTQHHRHKRFPWDVILGQQASTRLHPLYTIQHVDGYPLYSRETRASASSHIKPHCGGDKTKQLKTPAVSKHHHLTVRSRTLTHPQCTGCHTLSSQRLAASLLFRLHPLLFRKTKQTKATTPLAAASSDATRKKHPSAQGRRRPPEKRLYEKVWIQNDIGSHYTAPPWTSAAVPAAASAGPSFSTKACPRLVVR